MDTLTKLQEARTKCQRRITIAQKQLAEIDAEIGRVRESAPGKVQLMRLSEADTDRQIESIHNFREVLGIGNSQPVPFEGESPEAYARRCGRA